MNAFLVVDANLLALLELSLQVMTSTLSIPMNVSIVALAQINAPLALSKANNNAQTKIPNLFSGLGFFV
jgi:hypothetical protein